MKKLFSFFAILWLALGFCYAQGTGAPVNRYNLSMEEGTYRTLSASATVLFSPTEEIQINHKYIVKKDSLVSETGAVQGLQGPSFPNLKQQPATILLDENFRYGTVQVGGIGISTDGCLFFGDMVKPAYYGSKGEDNVIYYLTSAVKNYVFFYLADKTEKGNYTTPLYARQGSKIGYEKEGDLLIIAYENLYIKESETEEQQISWNYQINLTTGDIALQTKGFYTDAAKNYPTRAFAYGLVGTSLSAQVWLAGFKPLQQRAGSSQFVSLAKDSLQEGALYSFIAPERCKAVENPTINWKINVTDKELSLSGTTWEGASRALFMLSEKETLSAEEQPQNGRTFYGWNPTGSDNGREIIVLPQTKADALDSLWVGKGLLAEYTADGKYLGLDDKTYSVIKNLKPVTDYWIHAYVYDNTCLDGPIYGTAVKRKITTSMEALSPAGMVLSDVTEDAMKLTLPALPQGETYYVAVSESAADGAKNILKNGTAYQTGDKVWNGTVHYAGVGAGSYEFKGLKSGTSYYVWIWRSMGSGENIQYSAGCVELADKTVFRLPVDIQFERSEYLEEPLAWRLGMSQDAYNANLRINPSGWQVAVYKENEMGSGMSAKAPAVGTYILSNQFFVNPDLEDVSYPKTISAYAISPMISKNIEGELGLTFNVGFFTKDNSGRATVEKAYNLKDGDSLVISWAENRESTTWKRLAVVDKNNSFDADGFIAATVSGFDPMGIFCFKLEFFHAAADGSDAMGAAIQSIQVKQDLPCKPPYALTVAQGDLTHSSAVVSWEDGNPEGSWAEKFIVKYCPEGSGEWLQDSVIDTRIQLTGLKHSTNYALSVQAVCDEETGRSLEVTGGFSTKMALEIPYSYQSGVQNALPAGSRNMRGLPGGNLVEIDPTKDAPADGWAMDIDAAGDLNTLALNLEANANTWLVLPVLLPDNMARVNLRLGLTAFGLNETLQVQEALKTHDSLWVFVSSTGDFKADRKVVGVVNIDDLHYKIANNEMLCDTVDMEFSVDPDKDYCIAFYVSGKGASANFEDTRLNMLAIGSIDMTYAAIEYPAVTDIMVDDLRQTGFRLSWKGQADSYKVLLKEAVAAKYDTISETTTSHTFDGLKENTRYAYRIYGIYDGKAGRISEEGTIRTLNDVRIDTVKTPEFSPVAGAVVAGTVVNITCATEGAAIYYTTDGSTPTTQSKRYLFGVSVDTAMVIKAIAMKEGMVNSAVAEAEYTVNVANESAELAGISLYPNPTSGSFKVVAPVRVKVEVFTSNGVLVKSFTMPAGTEETVLDNSGIYFVRFTSENGSVAVKRLVVR